MGVLLYCYIKCLLSLGESIVVEGIHCGGGGLGPIAHLSIVAGQNLILSGEDLLLLGGSSVSWGI